MGALFGIIFLMIALIIGILVIAFGVSGLIIFFMKKKTERPLKVRWGIGFVITLFLGIAIAAFPTLFFGFIFYGSSVPPENFVETEIVIEEDGYQSERFTADGVVYEAIGLYIYDDDAISTPVFSYKTEGFMNGYLCGNYYEVESIHGFELISDEYGNLFCTPDKCKEIIDFYSDYENFCIYYNGYNDAKIKLNDKEVDAVLEIIKLKDTFSQIDIVESGDSEYFHLDFTSSDSLIYYDTPFWFIVYENSVYLEDYSNISDDGEYISTTVKVLPEEISEIIFELYNRV